MELEAKVRVGVVEDRKKECLGVTLADSGWLETTAVWEQLFWCMQSCGGQLLVYTVLWGTAVLVNTVVWGQTFW